MRIHRAAGASGAAGKCWWCWLVLLWPLRHNCFRVCASVYTRATGVLARAAGVLAQPPVLSLCSGLRARARYIILLKSR